MPELKSPTRHDDLVELINDNLLRIQVGGAHLDEDTRGILREIFPNALLHNAFGSNMILGGVPTRQPLSEDDPVVFDARSPYITFSVIDPATGRPVGYGERGQVVMIHISKTVFLPNNLERDTAIRAQQDNPRADARLPPCGAVVLRESVAKRSQKVLAHKQFRSLPMRPVHPAVFTVPTGH
jgi:hypothetical protein